MSRLPHLAFLVLAAGLLSGCGTGSGADAQQEKDMKASFAEGRKPVDQLPPAERSSAAAMKEMAENMAKNGPKAGNGQK